MLALWKWLRAIPLRWWLYLAGAAVLGYVLLRERHQAHRANAATVRAAAAEERVQQANATIESMRVDAALNQETSHALAERLQGIERDRRDNPIRGVYLCPRLPSTASEGRATAGADDAGAERESAAAAVDLGPALDDYGTDCATAAAKLSALQAWEVARGH